LLKAADQQLIFLEHLAPMASAARLFCGYCWLKSGRPAEILYGCWVSRYARGL